MDSSHFVHSNVDHPNILVIMGDQHRWDCVGFNGNRQIKTPNLDRLAADGVNYPTTLCPYPICTPSRYSLLCGQYVHQHGGWNNRCTLDPGIPTFPRLLRSHGYHTRGVGKMHFTPTYLDVGLEELLLCEQDGDGRFDDDYHRDLMAAGLIDAIDLYDQRREYRQHAPQSYWQTFGALASNLPEEWHSTTWIGDRAVQTLESWTEHSNLLICSFVKPHHPFDPPGSWLTCYDPAALDLLPGWTDEVPDLDRARAYFDNDQLSRQSLRHIMAHYYATISHIDHQVGRMVDVLHQRDLYDNAMVLYLSDHGEYLGFHHMILKQGPAYDPLARVPLVIKYPQGDGAGTHSQTLANLVDVAPTILSQAAVPIPTQMPGLNLADAGAQRNFVFLENIHAGYYMARSHTHKLIWAREPAASQFFDLEKEPMELHNRIQDPEVQPLVAEFQDAVARWQLFESPPVLRLDPNAPTIQQPNVPSTAESQEVREYLERTVQPFLDPSPA